MTLTSSRLAHGVPRTDYETERNLFVLRSLVLLALFGLYCGGFMLRWPHSGCTGRLFAAVLELPWWFRLPFSPAIP